MTAKNTTTVEEMPVVMKEETKPNKTAKVAVEVGLNLRAGKSLETEILEVLAKDTEVVLIGKVSNGWQKVNVAGKIGYVVAEYLEF